MSGDFFDSALVSLSKPQEKGRLLKILSEIRRGVEGPSRKSNINKLYQKGCLKQLIANFQEPHLDVINLTLSILGNCCLERVCAREVVKKYNLLPYLNNLLKNYKQDSVQGRIFRIIGNMCQHWDRLANTVIERESNLHMVAKIIECLKAYATTDDESPTEAKEEKVNISSATITMAIRALRELTNSSTVLTLVKDCEVIKAVGMVIIKLTPVWQGTQQHEEILNNILKLLYDYSKRYPNYDIILQLQNTEKGNAVSHLGKLVALSPFMLIKIIVNLSEVRVTNLDLPFSDIFQNLVEKLNNPENFSGGREDPVHRDYLKCLCFLIQHPSIGNIKEEILNVNLIPTLLSILQDYTTPTDVAMKNCTVILSTLRSRYMFEKSQLLTMLKQGILPVLIDKLNWILGPSLEVNVLHDYKFRKNSSHKSRKRGRFKSDSCFMNQLTLDGLGIPCCDYFRVPIDDIGDFCKLKKRSLSPSSDTSMSSGPSYSPPSSPALSVSDTDGHVEENESDSDDYSPVCSDVEDAEPSNTMVGTPEGDNELNFEDITDQIAFTESTEANEKCMFVFKKQLADQIVKLIKLFALMKPPPSELSCSNLLIKLLQFLLPSNKLLCPLGTLRVILLVAQTPEFLVGLMQTDFVIAAYKFSTMPHGITCTTCTALYNTGQDILVTFTKLVEFGRGQGDIAHQLYRANISIKQKLASAIPFLTDNKYTLNNLMMTCGGLNILIQLFQRPSDLQQKCINGLCVMAKKLGIKNPTSLSENSDKFIELPLDLQQYDVEATCSTIVNFKLDDGSCVRADRDFLSQKSNYFNRLLSGEFKESWEEEIRLHNVPNKSLKLLLMLLQSDVHSTDVYQLDVELDVLLDVISLTDRYLMEDLCLCLTTSVQYFKLANHTAPVIYQWSLESGTNILRIETVAYALVSNLNDAERDDMFRKLLELGYSEHLAEDVQELLTRFLCIVKRD